MNDGNGLAELTLLATVANLQVNLEILEVSKQILKAHLASGEELKEIDKDVRTLQHNN
jgi:hypothetical protein